MAKLQAAMQVDKIEKYTVIFGLQRPHVNVHGPNYTPYIANLVFPKFQWESMGSPQTVIVSVEDEQSYNKEADERAENRANATEEEGNQGSA
jgi:hypothetical protein